MRWKRLITPPIGTMFGKWKVIGYGEGDLMVSECKCGDTRPIRLTFLHRGLTKQCDECRRESVSKSNGRKAMWKKYKAIQRRVSDKAPPKDLRYYRDRGIGIAPIWNTDEGFDSFCAELGPMPSPAHQIDRIDSMKGYQPGNIRWASPSEQAKNRGNNVHVTINGETMIIMDAVKRFGLRFDRFREHLNRGVSPEDAVRFSLLRKRSFNTESQGI